MQALIPVMLLGNSASYLRLPGSPEQRTKAMWTHSKNRPLFSIWPILKIDEARPEAPDVPEVPGSGQQSAESIGEHHCRRRGRLDDRTPAHGARADQ
jgi:hypothetical protein